MSDSIRQIDGVWFYLGVLFKFERTVISLFFTWDIEFRRTDAHCALHNNVDYILNALEEFSGVFEINLIFHKKYVCHMFLLGIFLWWCRTPTALTIKINTWSKRETWLHSSNDNAMIKNTSELKKENKEMEK